ncbi:MAG: LptF/LptG family permease [Rhodospirillaceae bacterium]|nr:LptF/LptG family permease [Rhodospirillales bacterium]
MTFALYLSRMFLARLMAGMLALAGLLQLVELMDKADEILERGLGVAGMARFAFYHLPLVLGAVLPIAVLMASTLTLAALARRGEIAAMRAAGLPVAQLVGWLIPVTLAVAAFHFVLADRVVPAADAAFARWWHTDDAQAERLWFRDGMDVVGVDRVEAEGRHLIGVELVRRQSDGRLAQWIAAERAEWGDGRWTLVVGNQRGAEGGARPFDRMPWNTTLVPPNLVELARSAPLLSTGKLMAALRGDWATRDSPKVLETRLWRIVSAPLTLVLLMVLATPVAGGTPRSNGIPAGMAVGLAAGLSYLLLDGILGALGEAGTLPPIMAAWLAHGAFACIGGAMLLYVEG